MKTAYKEPSNESIFREEKELRGSFYELMEMQQMR